MLCLKDFIHLSLFQLISSLVDMNTFTKMIVPQFSENPSLEWLASLEGSLIILASIATFSPYLGEQSVMTMCSRRSYSRPSFAVSDFELHRTEIISALARQDCLFSYLERFSIEPSELQSILDDVSEYMPPTYDSIHGLKEGCYRLKGTCSILEVHIGLTIASDCIWEDDVDPLHVLMRVTHRQQFEVSMQRFRPLWPPFRLHKPRDQFQTNLRCVLQSRYLHGIFFSIALWVFTLTDSCGSG